MLPGSPLFPLRFILRMNKMARVLLRGTGHPLGVVLLGSVSMGVNPDFASVPLGVKNFVDGEHSPSDVLALRKTFQEDLQSEK